MHREEEVSTEQHATTLAHTSTRDKGSAGELQQQA
jgi:hypothetical protein